MTERGARRLAWSAFFICVAFVVSSLALGLATKPGVGPSAFSASQVLFFLSTAVFPVVGILILARQPRNRIGWILMVIGLFWTEPFEAYGQFALSRGLLG